MSQRPETQVMQPALDVWPITWSPERAGKLATAVLGQLPNRLAHSLQAGRQARRLASTVPAEDADLLVSAALLHDIGYAQLLSDTPLGLVARAFWSRSFMRCPSATPNEALLLSVLAAATLSH